MFVLNKGIQKELHRIILNYACDTIFKCKKNNTDKLLEITITIEGTNYVLPCSIEITDEDDILVESFEVNMYSFYRWLDDYKYESDEMVLNIGNDKLEMYDEDISKPYTISIYNYEIVYSNNEIVIEI